MVLLLLLHLILAGAGAISLEDRQFWNSVANEEIEAALKVRWNEGVAKNVIVFMGDGMGPTTVTASRIYTGGESSRLSFESFPHVGLLKTYVVDKQVAESASSATALFCGVKSNFHTAGVDCNVKLNDCDASLKPEHQLDSILQWAQLAGKDTGFVTTTRITHATPSALYSHTSSRKWECESKIPSEARHCKDIARQMVENEPGKSINVIMGGGLQMFQSNVTDRPGDLIEVWSGKREDGRDLVKTWKDHKKNRGVRYKFLTNTQDLQTLDTDNTDFVLGIFSNSHFPMDFERNKGPEGIPSLEEMTMTSLKVLQKNNEGFVLVVEGGLIDFGHHRGHARQALDQVAGFNRAINSTMKWLKEKQMLDNTLVITTSDHAHSLAMTGYPPRGNNVLGIASKSLVNDVPYTTLSYTTGSQANFQYAVETNNNSDPVAVRVDPSKNDTTTFTYSQQATVLTDEGKHGGEDVAVYATGPMAHLFHSVHEQNYVAHVIAYASKIGPYKRSAASLHSSSVIMLLLTFIVSKVFLV